MFQMFELGTTYLVGSGYCVPFQDLLDADPYINLEDIEPALRNYYTYDGKMVCIPFNPSTAIMYFNKTAFTEAGLDPANPPRTFDDIAAIADKLTLKDGDKVTRHALGLYIYGWFFEAFLAGLDALYVNNDNGRTARATAIDYDQNGAGKIIMEKWKKLVDDGVIYNFGTNGNDAQAAFVAGQTAMNFGSTASLTTITSAVGDAFEVGTAYLPSMADSSTGGIIIGGANLWIVKNPDAQRQADAWDFLKYATSAEVSAKFSQATGYFCANMKAYETESMKGYLEAHPNFATAINQLHNSPDSFATRGASVGVMPELRAIFQENMELVLQGAMSVDDALAEMASAGNAAIESYNAANP
jgi:sn-glycerol 3-phosphate transport system substrate-binding protein